MRALLPATLRTPSRRRLELLLRAGLGVLFVAAGLAKLFALDATTEILAARGVPLPGVVGPLVGAAETLAGAMLLTGAWVRTVARVLLVGVVFAAVTFHDPFGLPPGAAHATAISLTVDAIVVLGLAMLAPAPEAHSLGDAKSSNRPSRPANTSPPRPPAG